ncbi:unnamed protein product [Schistosoma curassoni]|uniref:Uncharacterized protein n=1 Tax=Schistosoma curassoni TaxID=6186 RepID=A0A183L210_9TREM|nr:unnamed protein product [Schistosoma curassoni]
MTPSRKQAKYSSFGDHLKAGWKSIGTENSRRLTQRFTSHTIASARSSVGKLGLGLKVIINLSGKYGN